jgi:hypothetical protein
MTARQARQIILGGSTLEGTLAQLAQLAEDSLPGARAGYTMVDDDETCVRSAIFPSLPPTFQDALAYTPLTEPFIGSCVQSIRTGLSVVSNDILGDMRFDGKWREICLKHGIKSLRSTPLKTARRVEGTFVIGYLETSNDTRWTGDVMDEFAAHGAEAMSLYRTLSVNRPQRP